MTKQETPMEETKETLEEEIQKQENSTENLSQEVEKQIKELEEKTKEYESLLLRKAADFDNFRKRARQEKEQLSDMVAEKVIKDFLPIWDNLERALEAANQKKDFDGLMQGIISTQDLFLSLFGKYEVKKIDSIGKEFDPKIHEGLQIVEGDYEKQVVIGELEKVFMLKDKVMRLGRVMIGKPRKKEEAANHSEEKQESEKN
ncbi:MAG TPA: nucleotide exchange factor GrpE [Spirochaetia bacterium]|nr:MAG: nucleotide exchange factor GrpE [Spirochaetes bacterium GWB1_36_13]HCL56574.1 nucleotide exchange factor GrpE [Spirochaetia bacterium]